MRSRPDGWLQGPPAARPVPRAAATPAPPPKAGGERATPPTSEDLDRIAARRAEALLEQQIAGEMAFARLVGQAPSLMAELQKLKDEGRA